MRTKRTQTHTESFPIEITISHPLSFKKKLQKIIFIHMSWGGAWTFSHYLQYFASRGFSCHAIDLRGHGKSGGSVEGASMQDYVQDVRSAIEYLKVENPIIIGHSMGGLIALLYSSQYSSFAAISLDGSPPLEVQHTSEEKTYPAAYTARDSGMPRNIFSIMGALPDISLLSLMKMKLLFGVESGVARSDRKRGISIPRDSLAQPLLFIGAQNGTSLPFGIGIEKMRAQAEYYNAPVIEIADCSHPGLLFGKHWRESADAICDWIEKMIAP